MDVMPRANFGDFNRQGLELQEVTNAMVRIYKEQFGRGPTKARTNYAGRTPSFRRSRTALRRLSAT